MSGKVGARCGPLIILPPQNDQLTPKLLHPHHEAIRKKADYSANL